MNNSDPSGELACNPSGNAPVLSVGLIDLSATHPQRAQDMGVNWVYDNTIGPLLSGLNGIYSVTLGASAAANAIYGGSLSALIAIWSTDPANGCSVSNLNSTCETSYSSWVSSSMGGAYTYANPAWVSDWVMKINLSQFFDVAIVNTLTYLVNQATGDVAGAAANSIISRAFNLVVNPSFTPAAYSTPCPGVS